MLVPTLLTVILVAAIATATGLFFPMGGVGVAGSGLLLAVGVATIRYLGWRSAGVGWDHVAMTVQTGIIGSKRVRLGRNRIQSLHVRQTPFQRRAGLATIEAWSVSGSSKSRNRVSHVLLADAEAIADWFHCGTEESTRPA
jgi:putative membrane protein